MEYGDCEEHICILTFNDVKDQDESHYGLKGSPTKVERIFEPDKKKEKQMFEDGDLAKKVYEILKDQKFL